ncbi:alpha/beta hydrolase [Aquimarina gracilis]|uniref:Alpha/beta hydrolase n=1 Tax=Aquimarina gracilis TaxID=874422 RepID=A0ABU5ZX24_9FLAO|nr:alpha/beta hydrolase [Aquimarina gracilis]MEB3346407.1 alpha/beta hydrolase [Aquimarina gracilis]
MSFGYFLVKLVLKLKGEKQSWSEDPINYKKKRKQNIRVPNRWLLQGCTFDQKDIGKNRVTQIIPKNEQGSGLLIYCHGGAFVYGPTRENWVALAKIAKQSRTRAWMIDYPKAPENTIDTITQSVYQAYQEATKTYNPSNIGLMGDSAGGSLILTLTQRLVKEAKELPKQLIPITPIVDASVSNPKIKEIDKIDPILSLKGVLSANKMCVGDLSLEDPLISPLYGDIDKLPPIYLFMATDDILTPDQELFIEKIRKVNGNIEVITGKGLPHVWPILPIMKEAKEAIRRIVTITKELKGEG